MIDLCNFVINEYNPTCKVRGNGHGVCTKHPLLKTPASKRKLSNQGLQLLVGNFTLGGIKANPLTQVLMGKGAARAHCGVS